MNKYFYSLILVLTFALMPGGFVLAQPEAVKSAHQEVIESVDKLTEVEELNLSPEQKARRELELKKIALEKIIELSILETKNFKETLIGLEEYDSGMAEMLMLKNIFLAQLEDYLTHFSGVKNNLADSVDLADIKRIAGSFNSWRESVYNPEIKKIFDFILVFQNKFFLKVADLRFVKIALELRNIRSANLRYLIWEQFLNPAALRISEARAANNRALTLLSAYLPKTEGAAVKEESALAAAAETETAGNQAQETRDNPQTAKITIRDLVSKSLEDLREAYKTFIEVGNLIKVLR